MESGKSAEKLNKIISSFYGMQRGIVKMRIGPVLLSGFILLTVLWSHDPGAHRLFPRYTDNDSGRALSRQISVEDLKRSEKYLRKDLGLDENSGDSSLPLWESSLRAHPVLVFISTILFLGGILGFIVIYRRQSRHLKEGLEEVRKREAGLGGGISGLPKSPSAIREVLEKEKIELGMIPQSTPEKALRRVDSVLDSLRNSLGAGMRKSRISVFRYEENDGQFRICGFSKGPEFLELNMSAFSLDEVMGLPLLILSPFRKENNGLKEEKSWIFPFVVDSGGFCLIVLEMGSGEPPITWSDTILESLPLIKILIARQENLRDDVSLTTRDSSGSLDYRATMNRLLEEWGRTQRLGIPFSVIALRIDNLKDIEKYYGTGPLEMAWTKLTGTLGAILRSTDWIMRPKEDLLMIQVLEAGHGEGLAVMGRIVKILSRYGHSEKLEKGFHYRGILMSYPPETSLSIHDFLDQILRRLEERSDLEGTFFYA